MSDEIAGSILQKIADKGYVNIVDLIRATLIDLSDDELAYLEALEAQQPEGLKYPSTIHPRRRPVDKPDGMLPPA